MLASSPLSQVRWAPLPHFFILWFPLPHLTWAYIFVLQSLLPSSLGPANSLPNNPAACHTVVHNSTCLWSDGLKRDNILTMLYIREKSCCHNSYRTGYWHFILDWLETIARWALSPTGLCSFFILVKETQLGQLCREVSLIAPYQDVARWSLLLEHFLQTKDTTTEWFFIKLPNWTVGFFPPSPETFLF